MKWKMLFIFGLMFFVIPLHAKAETFYFNYSDYYYSDIPVQADMGVEVEEVFYDEKIMYRYRTRDYLTVPDNIYIYDRSFNIFSYIDTNIPLEDIEVINYYDLETMNNCDGAVEIRYHDAIISKLVHIAIKNYIKVPSEIVVTSYDFDIWEYIDTDIEDKSDVKFVGEYDLFTNGQYDLLITYYGIDAETTIIVEIEENVIKEDPEIKDDVIKEEPEIKDDLITNNQDQKEEVINEVTMYEIDNYSNNYSNTNDKCDGINKVLYRPPFNNQIIYKEQTVNNKYFYYISYGFYAITTILLSIIVVRKK